VVLQNICYIKNMTQEKPRYTILPRVLVFVFRNNQLLLMRYSGSGKHMTSEKAERKDIYNPIGGHIEMGEDVIEAAVKEAKEEAGITLLNPKIKGVVNVSGFAGKNIMNFIVAGNTEDMGLKSTVEGELEWVDVENVPKLNVFSDLKQLLDKLLSIRENEMFVGTASFDGKFSLQNIHLRTI
jgi:8-oxo-dGTP pyrophosphatase MutT (NUDIX family)